MTPRVERFLRDKLAGIPLDDVVSPEAIRADYSCLDGLVVVELKTLEEDASERVGNVTDELEKRPDWPIFFGSVPLEACLENLEGDTEQIRLNIVNRIGRSTIRHLRKADKQLRSHCAQFPRRDVVRLVILINEDHADYDPQTVAYILQHELKRWSGDRPDLGNIDAVIYLSERHAIVQDGLLVLPILSVEGYGSKLAPWKAEMVSRVVDAWGEWNGFAVLPHDGSAPEFEAMEVIPDVAPVSEWWRVNSDREPSLRSLTFEQLCDRFDEVNVMGLLVGLNDSPRKMTPQEAMPIFKQFGDIVEEFKHRRIPMQKVPQEPQRLVAAAGRLRLGDDVIDWIAGLGTDRQ